MNPIINITDITTYLFCPRKIYLKKVKKIKEKPTKDMISGMLKHKIFDIFNKNEKLLVYSIEEKKTLDDLFNLYKDYIKNISLEIIKFNKEILKKFDIKTNNFIEQTIKNMENEIVIRILSIKEKIDQGLFKEELWENLKPKFLTEFKIVSENLGLKGRIDRIEIGEEIIPYEIKTREEIFFQDKIQLAGYALLLEDKFNTKIDYGIVEVKSKKEKIPITPQFKEKVLFLADKIREIIKEEKEIPINNNFKKCENCKFKYICFEK